jgi:hypothetical protein
MGKLISDADQISGYGFSSTYLGNKALKEMTQKFEHYPWPGRLPNI